MEDGFLETLVPVHQITSHHIPQAVTSIITWGIGFIHKN
jgi:hypothetical protein